MQLIENTAPIVFPTTALMPDWLAIHQTMLLSREADRRESILFRQGFGKFQLPSAGHEGMAVLAAALQADDPVYCYYRDRALLLARGVSPASIALDYFGKKESSSGGRQMASHFFAPDYHVMSCASPTGLQCLPAAGHAWGIKLRQESQVVVCCIGDAATRQGEFYEAVAFAIQEQLPVLFVVEDNKYGISTSTQGKTPLDMGLLNNDIVHEVNGWDVENLFYQCQEVVENCRQGTGPQVLWMHCERLMSHTSADDQRTYRPAQELEYAAARHDPISHLQQMLISQGLLEADEIVSLQKGAAEEICRIYDAAQTAEDPTAESTSQYLLGLTHTPMKSVPLPQKETWNMMEAINLTLGYLLKSRSDIVLFGEDIKDPKGGVFGLTRGLSTRFPKRVFNSPLAEATIAGTASGLSAAGFFPIVELQFIDFVGPAFNQLVNQIATLRWRTNNRHQCPMIIMAPYGGYIAGGGPWHTQSNESSFARVPGLKVVIPSNAHDAALQLMTAANGQDPVLMLLPKRQFFRKVNVEADVVMPLYAEQPVIARSGEDITLVTWGNGMELAAEAAMLAEQRNIAVELIDLRSATFAESHVIKQSLVKTGRLMVVQEDSESCSLGQALISHLLMEQEVWQALRTAPKLFTRRDGWIPFHHDAAEALMPQIESIAHMIFEIAEA